MKKKNITHTLLVIWVWIWFYVAVFFFFLQFSSLVSGYSLIARHEYIRHDIGIWIWLCGDCGTKGAIMICKRDNRVVIRMCAKIDNSLVFFCVCCSFMNQLLWLHHLSITHFYFVFFLFVSPVDVVVVVARLQGSSHRNIFIGNRALLLPYPTICLIKLVIICFAMLKFVVVVVGSA